MQGGKGAPIARVWVQRGSEKGQQTGLGAYVKGHKLMSMVMAYVYGHDSLSSPESAVGHWPPSKCVAGDLPDQPQPFLLAEPYLLGRTEAETPLERVWLGQAGFLQKGT